jgi:hypothetical protein
MRCAIISRAWLSSGHFLVFSRLLVNLFLVSYNHNPPFFPCLFLSVWLISRHSVVLSSMWYKREEQAGIVTYWYMMNVSLLPHMPSLDHAYGFRVPNKLLVVFLHIVFPSSNMDRSNHGKLSLLHTEAYLSYGVSSFSFICQTLPCERNVSPKTTRNSWSSV